MANCNPENFPIAAWNKVGKVEPPSFIYAALRTLPLAAWDKVGVIWDLIASSVQFWGPLPLALPSRFLPAFTDSFAMATIILELLAIFSAHLIVSSTSVSTGKILLTRPKI